MAARGCPPAAHARPALRRRSPVLGSASRVVVVRARTPPSSSPASLPRAAASRVAARRAPSPAPARGATSIARASYASPSSPSPSSSSPGDDSSDWSELWASLKKQRWDAAPKPWREFWNTRVAAAVVEVDVDKESVNAKEVEGIGLDAPKDRAEALERVRHNVVVYRQNYVVVIWLAAFVSNAFQPLCAVGLAALAAAACCASDVLLGELALATNDRLTWNAARVAGLPRRELGAALGATASAALCAYAILRGGDLLLGVAWGLALSLCHAALRPIDLKSTLNELWNDAKGVQSREEAAALAKKGVRGLKSWWNNRRPAEPTPVVMNVKGDVNAAYEQAGFAGEERRREAERQKRRAENEDGVVDTEGWAKPDAKGELPPGKK